GNSWHRAQPSGFFAHRVYHFQREQPAALPGHRSNDGALFRSHGERYLEYPANLSGIKLCQLVQQVQSELSGALTVRGRLAPPVGRYMEALRCQAVRPNGAIGQPARRTPVARVGADHALQSLSRSDNYRDSDG